LCGGSVLGDLIWSVYVVCGVSCWWLAGLLVSRRCR
jgi:hypothetical protein